MNAKNRAPESNRFVGRRLGRRRFSTGWVAFVCIVGAASPTARTLAQHSTHAVHPLMLDERLYVRCRLPGMSPTDAVVAPLELRSPLMEQRPDQLIELPAGARPIRLLRFLPNATMEQSVVPAPKEGGRPAVEISIEGPTQSYRRWLVADDPERNRVTSYIGSWRFMSVTDQTERDELLRQFETEFTRDPSLVVSRADGGGRRQLAIHINDVQTLDDLGCKIRVRKFYPDYAMDRTTLIPVNQSDRRRNPAALVDIEHDGVTETRWVFAKFPGFQSRDADKLPYQVTLDCPAQGESDTPDFALVTIGRQTYEVWQRVTGATTSRNLTQDASIAIPNSPYHFRIANFVPNARLVEEYRSVEKGKGGPALEIEYADAAGAETKVWLELGQSRTVATPTGLMTLSFEVQEKEALPGVHP